MNVSTVFPAGPSVTGMLNRAASGDDEAMASVFGVLYSELRRLASAAMRHERVDHTLQPTALVHETFLRLSDYPGGWHNRNHFFALAATGMRRILVEHARGRNAVKRGSGQRRVSIHDVDVPASAHDDGIDLVALDTALARLAELDSRQARIVELRFFGGLTVEETASVIGISERTVKREWQMSRAWLRREMAQS
jgi:RNA polymerase sigma factor (TIGR02999 family)